MGIPSGYVSGQVVQAVPTGIQSALVLVKTQTIGSAVSSVEVTDAFSATYDNYKIILTGGAGTAATSLNLTLGATATGYYRARVGYTFASVDQGGGSGNQTSWSNFGSGSTSGLHMNCDVFSPFLAEETSANTATVQIATTGAASFSAGYLNNTTSYTAFTLTASTGTLTGGTIRVYGYAND